MISRYSTTSPSGTTTSTTSATTATTQNQPSGLELLENQFVSAGKTLEQSISLSTIMSIVVGGAITAVVWFFITRYLTENFPPKESLTFKKSK